MKGKSHTAFQYLVIFLHIVHMEPWWLVNVSASGIHRSAWSQTGSPVPPPPWLFILIKWFSSTGKRTESHKSRQHSSLGSRSPLLGRDTSPMMWMPQPGAHGITGKGLGLLKAESFWWEGKLKPQDLKRAIKVMMGNWWGPWIHIKAWLVAGGNPLLGLVHFPHD